MEARRFLVEGILPLLGVVLSFLMVIAVVWIVSRARQRRVEIQAELQSKLIEKFGSASELVTFLQSPVGKEFVNGVQTGNITSVRDRIVSGYRRAIVLSFFGVAFMALWGITDEVGLAWPGVLILALGLGYLFATMATAKLTSVTESQMSPRTPPEV